MQEFPKQEGNLPENKFEEKTGVTIERITGLDLDEKTLAQIVEVESKSFPKVMRSKPKELKEILKSEGIHFFARDAKNSIIGYLSSLRQSEEYDELVKDDPEFLNDPENLYVESIAVVPGRRREKTATHFLRLLIEQAAALGFKKVTMHARIESKFSDLVQNEFEVQPLRRIENWHGFGEPFDYLEIDLKKDE